MQAEGKMVGCILAAAAIAVASSSPALASVFPPDTLIAGTIQELPSSNIYDCEFNAPNPMPSTFKRNDSGPAQISFVGITYWVNSESSNAQYWQNGGQASLAFASATQGTMTFPFPWTTNSSSTPAFLARMPFDNYTQSYTAADQVLFVQYTLHLGTCLLPVHAIYRN